MKKIIVQHRSSHHSGYSGYAQLINYLKDIEVISGKSFVPDRIARFIKNNMSQKNGLFDSNSVHKNVELLKKQLFSKEKMLIHYLNGERDIRQAINWAPDRLKSIATFHKPETVLKNTISNPKYLRKLDGAIAVGVNQVNFLKEWLENEKIVYIPHGVDTNFFKPDFSKRKENSLLFVGQHLRDFEALNFSIPRLVEKVPSIEINVVLRNDFKDKILQNKNVKIYSGINDIKLRDMYQSSSFLFLPLNDVTACNSILEAMACGLPIITTDLEGNRGYGLNDDNSILIPKSDYFQLVDRTISSLRNQDVEQKKGDILRDNSINFEWKNISKRVEDYYDSFIY